MYTIGYDALSLDEFLRKVKGHGIECVIDVRRWGVGRRRPEFSVENLAKAFMRIGVEYVWLPQLGGYRRFGIDIYDSGGASCFKAEGFRAYALYITKRPDVRRYLELLVEMASCKTSALMCREGLPWRCHRKILSDYLIAKGFRVLHIIGNGLVEHRLSKCARIVNGELEYV